METIRIETWIEAPIERCFDAARDLDLHVRSLAGTNERAVGGRTTGLIEMGESVTWRARHFGVTQELTSKITAFDKPRYFQDSMQRGAFRSFVHDHFFEWCGPDIPVRGPRQECLGYTKMLDVVVFAAPLGILGRIAEVFVLRRYLDRLLRKRAEIIREAAAGTS
jgi:ligand-binding SRPBCC domain-containing protein